MGGGGSKPAETQHAASPNPKPQAKKAGPDRSGKAQSAPADRRESMVRRQSRRGSMGPNTDAPDSRAPQVAMNATLNGTHMAMRRGSTVARTRLTRDKVKVLGHDEFDSDDEGHDVFGKDVLEASANDAARRKEAGEEDGPASARFGRRTGGAKAQASVALGNDAGGDLSGAAANNLAGGIGKRETTVVDETTVTGRKQRAFFNNDEGLDDQPAKASSALAKAKKKAKTVTVQQELQRRQTGREMGGTASFHHTKSFGGTLSAQTNETPMTNGTPKLKQLLDQMRQFRFQMRAKKDMSDTDITDLQQQQAQYANAKVFMGKEVASLGRRVDILGRPVKDAAIEFIDSIIVETDQRGGNVEVVQAFMKHLVTINWTQECLEREWIMTAARDGSTKFLDVLLQLPMINDLEIQLDSVGILELCAEHKTGRIALCLIILKHWSVLNVAALKDEMAPVWQGIFADVASAKRARPNEDRSARMALLNKILSLSHLVYVNFHAIDEEDGLSILLRAIKEGDSTLVSAIVSNAEIDWNFVYITSGHTALSFAVETGSKLITELILGVRSLDLFTLLPICQGHVLDFAKKTKASPAIIAALEHKMHVVTKGPATSEQSSGTSYVQKKRAAAAAKLEPKVPEFVKNPPPNPDEDEPDWILDTQERPLVATENVVQALAKLADHKMQLAEAKKNLLSSAEAEARYFALEEGLPAARSAAADEIMALGLRVSVEGKDSKELVAATVDELMADQEAESNCKLIRVITYRVITVDFAPLITDHKWALNAVQAGTLELLRSILKVSKLWAEEDVVEMFGAAVQHPTKRIPLCNELLKHADQLRLTTHGPHLRAQFQELFDVLVTPKSSNPSEDRVQRQELLYRLCAAPFVTVQYEQEFAGSQTVFSRACREGDLEVVRVLVDLRMLRDINRVHSNKSTALMQAVVGNQVEVVQFLAADPSVDVTIKSPHGTAFELATKMRKDQMILKAIKDAGGS